MSKWRSKDLKSVDENLYKYKFYIAKIKNIELELGVRNSEELKFEKEELQKKVNQMDNVLNSLDEESMNLIKLRYFEKKSYDKISEIVELTPSHIVNKIKKVLINMKIALDPVIY